MTLKEKIESAELEIKTELEKLRNSLNQLSIQHKSTNNGWQYISALSITAQKLKDMNQCIEDIDKY